MFLFRIFPTSFDLSFGRVAFSAPILKNRPILPRLWLFVNFMAHEQVRHHTSSTPVSNSHKQWVETNMSLLADMNKLMAEVQKDDHYRLPIVHVDIISSNTGVSQYLRAPLISWNTTHRSPTDLRLLLKPTVDQSFLTDETEARSAAYLFWVVVQPVCFLPNSTK